MTRKAFSIVEVIIALMLLTVAAVAVGRFVVQVHEGLRQRELSSRLGWELENARETISSWAAADVTRQRIEALPISLALKAEGIEAHWQADVRTIDRPLAATEITLRLQCQLNQQTAEPAKLTFWRPVDDVE